MANLPLDTIRPYKTLTLTCSGTTDAGILDQCSRAIGNAISDSHVNGDVQTSWLKVTTWFTSK